MTTVFLDAVFKPFFLNLPWHGPTTDDRSEEISWRTASFKSFNVRGLWVSAWKLFTHRRIMLWLGTAPWRPTLKCHRKSRWMTETDSPLLTNASYTNMRCSTGQISIATEVANPEEKNADHLVPLPRPTYWLLPIQKMSGSLGSPCTSQTIHFTHKWLIRYIKNSILCKIACLES